MYMNKMIVTLQKKNPHVMQAMIVFNASGAAMLMPTREVRDGKRYKVWNILQSKEKAEAVARTFKGRAKEIVFAHAQVRELPTNPEAMLCRYFSMNF